MEENKHVQEFIDKVKPFFEKQTDNCETFAERYINKFKPYFKSKELFTLFSEKTKEFYTLFSKCTGSSSHHHSFRGGLLVHTFEMLDILYETFVKCPENAKQFNYKKCPDNLKFNWDEIAVSILYHDWGKTLEYDHTEPNSKGNWNVTKYYRTHGHIFMSANKFINDAKKYNVPTDIVMNISHNILAHHLKLEWGSPVTPQTPEARIVSACDLISAHIANKNPHSSYYEEFVNGQTNHGNCIPIFESEIKPTL